MGLQRPRTARARPASCGFDFVKEERRVGMYYFYVLDDEFGPGFIKICTYFPYPAKVWLNGHEWAKRQARHGRPRLRRAGQRVRLLRGPGRPPGDLRPASAPSTSEEFFDRWTAVIPTPFTDADQAAGYCWELSMRQVEVSPHPGLRRPSPRPGVLRVARHRQRRHRPTRAGGHAVFGPTSVVVTTTLPYRAPGCSRPGTEVKMDFSLQAQPRQAIPEGREGTTHRDRHQQAQGHRGPRPPRAPTRAGGARPARSTTVCL